jgi:hypothetical protein
MLSAARYIAGMETVVLKPGESESVRVAGTRYDIEVVQ